MFRHGTERVFIGLGTNMGQRMRNLRRALFALAVHPEIEVCAVSRVFETEYVGPGNQDPYYNACVEIVTSLAPAVLLAVLKGVEEREGRRPTGHMLPRPIDLDILLIGDKIISEEKLQIPHKGMRDRAFVMEPLAELASEVIFPDSGETIGVACAKIRRKSGSWIRALTGTGLMPGEIGGPARHGSNKEDWRAALAVHCR